VEFATQFSATVTAANNSISSEMVANSHSLSGPLLLLLLLLLSGCATGGQPLNADHGLDPFERSNRAVFAFNQRIDQLLFKPVAEIYKKQLPPALRAGVSNFFRNLGEPTTILNDILQGKGRQTINDGARFAINTTLGVFGLFDVAGPLGLVHHQEDYGQTLARWGFPTGPYLVLPVFGSSNVRDVAGRLPAFYLSDPLFLISDEPYLGAGRYGLLHAGFRTLHAIDLRAQLLGVDPLVKLQLDPYLFMREAYHQQRVHAINDYRATEKIDPAIEEALFSN
jgi:phospholipid-binding lipoprotein MlaA